MLVQEAIALVGAESGVSGLRATEGMVCKRYFRKGSFIPLDYCWPPMHGLPGWLMVHKVPYLTNDAHEDRQIVRELCLQFDVRSALSVPIITANGEVVGFFEIHNKRDLAGFTWSDQKLLTAVAQTAAICDPKCSRLSHDPASPGIPSRIRPKKGRVLATLAHELRNPLAPLRNGLELLRLARDEEPLAAQTREMMERQLGQLVRLVDDLLDVSRINRGKLNLRKARIQLHEVIQGV